MPESFTMIDFTFQPVSPPTVSDSKFFVNVLLSRLDANSAETPAKMRFFQLYVAFTKPENLDGSK